MDPQHPAYMEPLLLAGCKAFFDKAYAELMKERAPQGDGDFTPRALTFSLGDLPPRIT